MAPGADAKGFSPFIEAERFTTDATFGASQHLLIAQAPVLLAQHDSIDSVVEALHAAAEAAKGHGLYAADQLGQKLVPPQGAQPSLVSMMQEQFMTAKTMATVVAMQQEMREKSKEVVGKRIKAIAQRKVALTAAQGAVTAGGGAGAA